MNYGLSKKHLSDIKEVLERFPEVERGVLFGSRAMGNHRRSSDIDIAVEGKSVDWKVASSIEFFIKEATPLPYFFDIVAYPTIKSENLIGHIKEQGVVIYERKHGPGRPLKPARAVLMDKILGRGWQTRAR